MKIWKIMVLGVMMSMMIPMVFGGTMKIYAEEDAYIDSKHTTSNYNEGNLDVGYDWKSGVGVREKLRAYLKFDLSDLEGYDVTDAKFSIFSTGGANGATDFTNVDLYYVSSDSWSESTLTWNNAPVYSTTLIDSMTVSALGRYEMDINQIIDEQDGTLSVMLRTPDEYAPRHYARFYSGWSHTEEVYKPYLEVTYEGDECPSQDYSNVCCVLDPIQMMGLINAFNNFEADYSALEMMGFINNFNRFEELC